MHWYFASWHWLETHLGILPLKPSRAYNWWSGSGSDLGELAIIAALVGTARKWNCHIKGCWRLAHHEYDLDGVKYHLCRVHHPATDTRPTLSDFDAHHAAMVDQSKPAKGTKRDEKGRFA